VVTNWSGIDINTRLYGYEFTKKHYLNSILTDMEAYSFGYPPESRVSLSTGQCHLQTDHQCSDLLGADSGGRANSNREYTRVIAHRFTSGGMSQYLVEWTPSWADEADLVSPDIEHTSRVLEEPYSASSSVSRINTPISYGSRKRSSSAVECGDYLDHNIRSRQVSCLVCGH
jgi:hypothetical protein